VAVGSLLRVAVAVTVTATSVALLRDVIRRFSDVTEISFTK